MRYAVFFLILAAVSPASAQSRANQIAAEFTRTKAATKTKKGVTSLKYKEVVSEVWRAGVRDYAGRYVSLGDESWLAVSVDARGSVTARGDDGAAFNVRDAQIADAVLYGTKAYRDGRVEPLEAAFLKRSSRVDPDDRFTATYGIGILMDAPPQTGITGTIHVFLARQ